MTNKIEDNWKNGICLQRGRGYEGLVASEPALHQVCVAMNENYIVTALQNANAQKLIIWNRLTLKTESVT